MKQRFYCYVIWEENSRLFSLCVIMFNNFAHYLISWTFANLVLDQTQGNNPDGPDLTSDPNRLHFESSSDMQNKPLGVMVPVWQ